MCVYVDAGDDEVWDSVSESSLLLLVCSVSCSRVKDSLVSSSPHAASIGYSRSESVSGKSVWRRDVRIMDVREKCHYRALPVLVPLSHLPANPRDFRPLICVKVGRQSMFGNRCTRRWGHE